jgi:hypothetical protein
MGRGWRVGAVCCLVAAGCGPGNLAISARLADVGSGSGLVLVGADAVAARDWLAAATPGYRFVQVTEPADSLLGSGRRVLVVPARHAETGLRLAEQEPAAVAGILYLSDGPPPSPAWLQAVQDHGWRWRVVTAQAEPRRIWWQDWLPARQAAFSILP